MPPFHTNIIFFILQRINNIKHNNAINANGPSRTNARNTTRCAKRV